MARRSPDRLHGGVERHGLDSVREGAEKLPVLSHRDGHQRRRELLLLSFVWMAPVFGTHQRPLVAGLGTRHFRTPAHEQRHPSVRARRQTRLNLSPILALKGIFSYFGR